MKHLLAAATLLIVAGAANAGVIGTVESSTGRIDLHDEEGPCVGKALKAVYVPLRGKSVDGCWVTGGPVVMIVFLDADVARVPAAAIAPPKAA